MTTTAAAREVAEAIKQRSVATTAQVADDLDLSYETVRAHISTLADVGLIEATRPPAPPPTARPGRPVAQWRLTRDGEHLFPKHYDGLAITLLDTVVRDGGREALDRALAELVDAKVAAWAPRLAGSGFDERVEALTGIYDDDDEYISVERHGDDVMLVERNCPYLDVAQEHPALCGLTLNTLSRLLGRRVVRDQSFQRGDGRCVFRVTDAVVDDPTFVAEDSGPAHR